MLGILPLRKYLHWLMTSASKHHDKKVYIPTHNAYDLMSLANQIKFDSDKYSVAMHFAFDDVNADLLLGIKCSTKGTHFGFRLRKITIGQDNISMGLGDDEKYLGSKVILKADSSIIRQAMPEFCRHIMPDLPYNSRDMDVCMNLSNLYYTASARNMMTR